MEVLHCDKPGTGSAAVPRAFHLRLAQVTDHQQIIDQADNARARQDEIRRIRNYKGKPKKRRKPTGQEPLRRKPSWARSIESMNLEVTKQQWIKASTWTFTLDKNNRRHLLRPFSPESQRRLDALRSGADCVNQPAAAAAEAYEELARTPGVSEANSTRPMHRECAKLATPGAATHRHTKSI